MVLLLCLVAAVCLAEATPQEIAFQSDRDGNDEIYLMGADGERPVNLTHDLAAQDQRPVWSPDGTRLAFMSDRLGKWDMYLLDLVSRGVTSLVDLDVFNVPYAWSPDGRWISFHATSGRSGDEGRNFLVRSDDRQLRGLPWAQAYDTPPVWSPDGQWIAFVAWVRDGNREIYVAHADGSDARNLTRSDGSDEDPAWSPDGTRLAFVTSRDGNQGSHEVYVTDVDGSISYNLTKSPGLDTSPDWSPDGRRIAFATYRDGNWEIYAVDADGGTPVNLTRNPADDIEPTWRPMAVGTTDVRQRAWGDVKRELQE